MNKDEGQTEQAGGGRPSWWGKILHSSFWKEYIHPLIQLVLATAWSLGAFFIFYLASIVMDLTTRKLTVSPGTALVIHVVALFITVWGGVTCCYVLVKRTRRLMKEM